MSESYLINIFLFQIDSYLFKKLNTIHNFVIFSFFNNQ